jgi:hypothetical protein
VISLQVRQAHGQDGTPLVFQAAGPTVESLEGTLDEFRAALGGDNNANNPGPIATGRREINWDGGGAATTVSPTPFAGFQNIRGALFTTPGTDFVQAPPDGLATTFNNATYVDLFKAFSPLRLFSPVGSNITNVRFSVPGNPNAPATVSGFGAIFSDVDRPDGTRSSDERPTRIEYFGDNDKLLFRSTVASSPGDGHFSFLGIVFEDPRIVRVRIRTGDDEPGRNDTRNRDIVVMDDFIYGEPQPVP